MSPPNDENPAPVYASGTGPMYLSRDQFDAPNSAVSLTEKQVIDCLLLVSKVRPQLHSRVPLYIEMVINWTAPDLPYAVRQAAYRLFEKGVV